MALKSACFLQVDRELGQPCQDGRLGQGASRVVLMALLMEGSDGPRSSLSQSCILPVVK